MPLCMPTQEQIIDILGTRAAKEAKRWGKALNFASTTNGATLHYELTEHVGILLPQYTLLCAVSEIDLAVLRQNT